MFIVALYQVSASGPSGPLVLLLDPYCSNRKKYVRKKIVPDQSDQRLIFAFLSKLFIINQLINCTSQFYNTNSYHYMERS